MTLEELKRLHDYTVPAGWKFPFRVHRSTAVLDGTDIDEADGTRVCIAGPELDALFIAAAIEFAVEACRSDAITVE